MRRFWGRSLEGTGLGTPGYKVRPNNTINKKEAFDFLGIKEEYAIHPCCIAALYEYYGNDWKSYLDQSFTAKIYLPEELTPIGNYAFAWDLSFNLYPEYFKAINNRYEIPKRYNGYHYLEIWEGDTLIYDKFQLFICGESESYQIELNDFDSNWLFLRNITNELGNNPNLLYMCTQGIPTQIQNAINELNEE